MAGAIAAFAVISIYIAIVRAAHADQASMRRPRERSAIRALAMRQLQSRYGSAAPIALQDPPGGAPRAQVGARPVAISWSHTSGCQVLGLSETLGCIGVDVERAARLQKAPKAALRLARRLWPADFVQGLSQMPLNQAARAVVRLWCLHEALAKCTEHGIARTRFSLARSGLAAVLRGRVQSPVWLPVPTCTPYRVRLVDPSRMPPGIVVAVAAPQPTRLMTQSVDAQ